MPRAVAAPNPVDVCAQSFDNTPRIVSRLTFPQRGHNVENSISGKTIPTIRAVLTTAAACRGLCALFATVG